MAMTPAERLRAAADTIERKATDAAGAMGEGRWTVELTGDGYATRSGEGYLTADAMAEEVAEHVAMWDPPTALLLAQQLRESADQVEVLRSELTPTFEAFLDRILTGGAS
jgi:hypothetical protein